MFTMITPAIFTKICFFAKTSSWAQRTISQLTSIKSKCIQSLIVGAALTAFPQMVFAGNEGARGGDYYAKEFFSLGSSIVAELEKRKDGKLVHEKVLRKIGIDIESLKKTVNNELLVYSAEPEEVTVGIHKTTATNRSGGPIIINRADWRKMFLKDKLDNVAHEYLGVLDIEVDTYPIVDDLNAILTQLAKSLIESKSLFIKYYGTTLASPALHNLNPRCQNGQNWLESAKTQAAANTKARCQSERNTECEPAGFMFREINVPSLPGLNQCEVVAITR